MVVLINARPLARFENPGLVHHFVRRYGFTPNRELFMEDEETVDASYLTYAIKNAKHAFEATEHMARTVRRVKKNGHLLSKIGQLSEVKESFGIPLQFARSFAGDLTQQFLRNPTATLGLMRDSDKIDVVALLLSCLGSRWCLDSYLG